MRLMLEPTESPVPADIPALDGLLSELDGTAIVRVNSPQAGIRCARYVVAVRLSPTRDLTLTHTFEAIEPPASGTDVLIPLPHYTYRPSTMLGMPVPLASEAVPLQPRVSFVALTDAAGCRPLKHSVVRDELGDLQVHITDAELRPSQGTSDLRVRIHVKEFVQQYFGVSDFTLAIVPPVGIVVATADVAMSVCFGYRYCPRSWGRSSRMA